MSAPCGKGRWVLGPLGSHSMCGIRRKRTEDPLGPVVALLLGAFSLSVVQEKACLEQTIVVS